MKALITLYIRTALLLVLWFLAGQFSYAQGLINNGAHIETTSGSYLYIDGGAGIGNVVNNDIGAFTGTIENQGTIDVTGDWTNLSAGNVFNASTGSTRLLGANQFIMGTSSTYFNNLTLLGSGIKTLNIATLTGGGFAAPTGILDLTTLPLDLNGNRLTVNNPATNAITNTTGYIISETPAPINPSIVQWNVGANNGLFTYPFGVAGTPIPVLLNKSAGTGDVSISTRATALANNTTWQATVTNMYSGVVGGPGEIPVVIDRWWDVDPSAAVTAMLSFTYRGSENTTTFNPTGTFAAQNWNSTQWLPPVGAGPGVLAGTASVVVPAQILTTTPWVLSNLTAPLPVELVNFTATCEGNKAVEINWNTASESNNDFFTLEKSSDGISYTFLATIKSKGNSSQLQQYSYSDHAIYTELTYYRLIQTNTDGKSENFGPVSAKGCNTGTSGSLHVWSSEGLIHILIESPVTRNYTATLYDVQGRLLFSEVKQVQKGTSEILLKSTEISKGVYFLNLINAEENFNFKIISGN